MKYSEMVNKIADIIHEHRRATHAVTSIELSIMVLSVIEKYGMLPPVNPEAIEDHYYTGLACYHEWEPEDER